MTTRTPRPRLTICRNRLENQASLEIPGFEGSAAPGPPKLSKAEAKAAAAKKKKEEEEAAKEAAKAANGGVTPPASNPPTPEEVDTFATDVEEWLSDLLKDWSDSQKVCLQVSQLKHQGELTQQLTKCAAGCKKEYEHISAMYKKASKAGEISQKDRKAISAKCSVAAAVISDLQENLSHARLIVKNLTKKSGKKRRRGDPTE